MKLSTQSLPTLYLAIVTLLEKDMVDALQKKRKERKELRNKKERHL